MNKRLTDAEKLDIVNKYNSGNYSCYQLDKEYCKYKGCVLTLLKRRGIKINNDHSKLSRKYTLNEHYFDVIDTEAKAYFLGLLYADGYNNCIKNCVVLGLQEKDKHILEEFNKEIGSNKPLQLINLSKKNKNWQDAYRLVISGKKISERLVELGCVARKTLILKFPTTKQVPEYLLRHFIRGYFDGDGCLCIHQRRFSQTHTTCFSLVSTLNFCKSLKRKLKKTLNIYSSISDIKQNNITKEIRISGKNSLLLLNWLYDDSKFYLSRKYDKYLQLRKLNDCYSK